MTAAAIAGTIATICTAVAAATPLTIWLLTRLSGRSKERAELAAADSKLATDYRALAESERVAHAQLRAAGRRLLRVIDAVVMPVMRSHAPEQVDVVSAQVDEIDGLL